MGPGVMRRPAAAAKGAAGAMGAAAAVAAGGEPAARECFEPAAAAAAGGELEAEKECLEPAVAEGAGGESEAEEDCDIAEPAPKRAARDKEKAMLLDSPPCSGCVSRGSLPRTCWGVRARQRWRQTPPRRFQ